MEPIEDYRLFLGLVCEALVAPGWHWAYGINASLRKGTASSAVFCTIVYKEAVYLHTGDVLQRKPANKEETMKPRGFIFMLHVLSIVSLLTSCMVRSSVAP